MTMSVSEGVISPSGICCCVSVVGSRWSGAGAFRSGWVKYAFLCLDQIAVYRHLHIAVVPSAGSRPSAKVETAGKTGLPDAEMPLGT